MPTPQTLLLFAAAALALLLLPGPVVLYTIARSLHQGQRAGAVSALAAGTGNFVHVLAATLGLSALLLSSALAFSIVKYAGAAYLIYLGIKTLLDRRSPIELNVQPMPLRRVFSQGMVVAILNPKTALFFLAFLPQFIDPSVGPVATQTLILGSMFALMGVVTDNLYAAAAGTLRGWLKGSTAFLRGQRYVAGGVYLALGAVTALSGERTR